MAVIQIQIAAQFVSVHFALDHTCVRQRKVRTILGVITHVLLNVVQAII